MEKNNAKRIAIVHDIKDANSRAMGTKVLPAIFKKLGANIINEGNYVTFQTKDFDFGPQVTKLKGMDRSGLKPPLFPNNTPGPESFSSESR